MFLDSAILKKLMKEAYRGGGLAVANTGKRIYIAGNYWEMDIERKHLPKTILAQIIELAGDIPADGERFNSTKTGNQMEVGKRMEVVAEADATGVYVTKMMLLSGTGVCQRILQTVLGEIVLIDETAIKMIEKRCIDSENGEVEPIGPLYVPHKGVFWANNIMRFNFMYRTVDDEDEQKLISDLEKITLW